MREKRKNIITNCVTIAFAALLFAFITLRISDHYEKIVEHFYNYHIFEFGLFTLVIVYVIAIYKNEALKGAEKQSILSETLHVVLFFIGFSVGVAAPHIYSDVEVKTWIGVVVMLIAMFFSMMVGEGLKAIESEPFDLVILALVSLVYYLLASLFSWSFNMDNWKWFSKVIFWMSTMLVASYIIDPYRNEK